VVVEGDQLAVATGDGLLAIRQLQPSGKRVMAAKDFLRGYHVRPGDTFAAA
jgi:methionyl-tRNA formyltransferase